MTYTGSSGRLLFDVLENGAEQTADVRRLRFRLRRRGLLSKRSTQRRVGRLPLRRCLRMVTSERRENNRSENHQQLSRLIGRQPRGLLHTLLHGLLMLTEHLPENPAAVDRRSGADETAETTENSCVRAEQ